jgi:hypothetical protein
MQNNIIKLIGISAVLLFILLAREMFPKLNRKSQFMESMSRLDKDAITTIDITRGIEQATLTKEGEKWKINGKFATSAKVQTLLEEMYIADQPDVISESKDRYVEFLVDDSNAAKIRLNDTITLFIGSSDSYGTYTRIDGIDSVFLLANFPSSDLSSFEYWVDKTIIAVERSKTQKLTMNFNGRTSSIVKKDAIWVKENTDIEISKDKIDAVFLTLGSFLATSFATPQEKAVYSAVADIVLTVQDDATAFTLEFYKGDSDYLVRRNSDGELFHVASPSVKSIIDLDV